MRRRPRQHLKRVGKRKRIRVINRGVRYRKVRRAFAPVTRKDAFELTAAERFGRSNIKNLNRLGQGRDRVVYDFGDDKVLKIAKNKAGLMNISKN